MRHLKPLLLLPLLAACAEPGEEGRSPLDIFSPPPPVEEPEPEPLPPNVAAALPPGVPSSVVLQDAAGCYLYSVEVTDPPSGFPLRDAAGNPICEGGASIAAVAPPLVAPPVTSAPITSAPIGSAPLPDESPSTAPPPPGPAVPPTGSITPPAPITPPS